LIWFYTYLFLSMRADGLAIVRCFML
jgi:hypothetical protein